MTSALRTRDRLAAAFLLGVLAVGCVGLFLGVPLGILWGLSQLTDSFVAHFVLGLVGIPLAIVVLAPALFWVNGLYLRVTAPREPDPWGDPDEDVAPGGGPLEPMLVVAFVIAAVAFAVWFLLLAENPVLTT